MEKDTITYEIGYLLNQSMKDEEISAFLDNLKNTITEKEGLIVSEGATKRMALAYPIKKESSAIFNWIIFKLSSENIKDLKNLLDNNHSVLRHLIIKIPKERPMKPSIKPFTKKKEPAENVFENQKIVEKTEKEEGEKEAKPEVKEEEIDKKIEEILGE